MTSSASQPNTNSAPNTIAAPTAPSYASAAGATKKPSSAPLVVGANPPSSVAGSSAASAQHAQNPSVTNVNGRQSVSPAVPTVAHGNTLNGDSATHGRNGSVTIAAPNGYNNKAPAPRDIQFGYDKTPQSTPAAPVPIPGAQRIPSPAHSPSPIPQPSASGGKPGATDSAFKIGSFTNDGEVRSNVPPLRSAAQLVPRYANCLFQRGVVRPNSMQMPFHTRRDSAVSQHSDVGHHGGQGPNRGGFPPQGGRGRGYNPSFNGQMGYPPNNQYGRGPHNQGRGGMPSQGFGRGGMQPYPNSPQPARGSPAMPHAMPGQSTPNMNPAVPVPPAHNYGHQYGPPMSGPGFPPQVNTPIPHEAFVPFSKHLGKKKAARWVSENRPSHSRQPAYALQVLDPEYGVRQRRLSKRRDSTVDYDRFRGRHPLHEHHGPPHIPAPLVVNDHVMDLSPGPDGFDRIERMLTETKQNFQPYGFDPSRAYMGYPQQMPMFAPGSPAPGAYTHHYASGAFPPPPPAPAMSRNNSQMSERPASSTGQSQGPLNTSGPPQPQSAPVKGPVIASSSTNQFVKPKSSAIQIKNAAGEVVNLASLRAPASPSPGIQQSKTPPVIASTPTPPPKSSTPSSHTRNESTATTKPDEIIAAFKEQIKKAQEEEATKADDKTTDKSAADAKAQEAQRKEDEEREQKAAEAKAAEEAEAKAKAEAETKAKEEAEAKAKAEEEKAAADAAAAAAAKSEEKPAESEEDEIERIIREMEEADRRREEEQAAITAKKNIEKEAAKKKADAERAASAAENDRKLQEQEREMERIEEEKEKAREKARLEAEAGENKSVAETLTDKISEITSSQKKDTPGAANAAADKLSKLTINSSRDAVSPGSAPSSAKSFGKERAKPAALNLAPLKTGSVEAPPPSAAMQALKSSRFLTVRDEIKYPNGIASPNPALNAAAAKKGGSFKYDSAFLLQFQKVFTEQPSVEFSQQVKALIGDSDGSRSASSRAATGGARQGSNRNSTIGNFSSMGTFAQPAKTLPAGTTSEQRFAMSSGQMSRPTLSGPMASFSRGGFPGTQMTRTPSGANLASSSSRNGSRNQPRGNSKRNYNDTQAEAKLAKAMPLTQGIDVKPITTSSSGWKPMSLSRNAAQNASGHLDPETVQRKVKAALNKMTPENFDKISEQILEIAAQSKDEQDGRTLRQVIQLTFEKATDEAHWAAMYAKFCKRMLENMSPEVKDVTITDKNGNVVSGGALFRKYLLNRCQEDFERGWAVEMPEPKDGETKETALMSDEYYTAMAIKRRGLGLVQFIGELFKLGMLTERIMHECVRKLLDFKDEPDEAEIESLSKLLRTIGANLDSTEKGNAMMNAYFERISNLVETPDLPSRLKFMLMDIVDLRRSKWAVKEGLKGPKTLEEIRAEVSRSAMYSIVGYSILTTPYRLRLLPQQRLLRRQERTPATSQVADPSLVGVTLAIRTPASLNLLLTRLAWMTCVVSRARHQELLVAMSLLDLPPCSALEATVAAG